MFERPLKPVPISAWERWIKVRCWRSVHLQDRDGKAFPSLTKIAERAGIHRATVAKCLINLEAFGYITRNQRTRRGKSEFDSTLYAIPGIAIHKSDEFPAPG